MLDIKFIRENVKEVKKGTAAKQVDPKIVDKVLKLDKKRREIRSEVEKLRAKRNKIAKQVKDEKLYPKGIDTPSDPNIDTTKDYLIVEGSDVKKRIQELEKEEREIENKFNKAHHEIPNLPASDVKEGKDEDENEIIRKWGEPKTFDFKPKNHWDLGENLGIIDTKRGSKVSGSRFFYLKGDGVALDFALQQLGWSLLQKHGFTPIIPPVLIKSEMMKGMGYMEHGGVGEMYALDNDDLVLVGTSEQAIGPMHANETLNVKDLPIRYMGYSTCFRREAGSYGKDTKGAFRVHQFNKVEMFSFCKAEDSDKEHELLVSIEEELLQKLELPYQLVKMCSGDLGLPAARKYDLDAWFPGQGKYRELTSASTTTDYQSRRLKIKYQEGGQTKYAHMLNGTVFSQRPILAILENYQQKDGSVIIPKVLQEYIGKEKITPKT